MLKNAKPPKSNISREERQALADLKNDDTIYTVPADKGRAVVVMDRSVYEAKMGALLSDTKTYEKLKKTPTAKYKTQVIDTLKDLKAS